MGIKGHSVPETYYYSAHRPYRPGEGGHNDAKFMPVDIASTFQLKVEACVALGAANRAYATHVKQRLDLMNKASPLLREINDASSAALARAWVEELARNIGAKHGYTYG